MKSKENAGFLLVYYLVTKKQHWRCINMGFLPFCQNWSKFLSAKKRKWKFNQHLYQ